MPLGWTTYQGSFPEIFLSRRDGADDSTPSAIWFYTCPFPFNSFLRLHVLGSMMFTPLRTISALLASFYTSHSFASSCSFFSSLNGCRSPSLGSFLLRPLYVTQLQLCLPFNVLFLLPTRYPLFSLGFLLLHRTLRPEIFQLWAQSLP